MNSPRITLTAALLVSASISLGLGMRTALAQPADLQPGVQTSADADAAHAATASAQPPGAGAPTAAAPGPATPGAGAPAAARPAAARAAVAQAAAVPSRAAPTAAAPAAAQSSTSAGADRLELGTTEISGNRELPKLMYVVPWRRDQLGNFAGRPPNSLVDEALAPVDRTVFERQNRYYAALQAATQSAKSQPGAAGAGARTGRAKDEK
ncbi:MAG TPA: hypothetical protein VHX52_02050 [Steroidobacteraceae bacterium]|jgi:hypothetical protein|nr:hypothetical protein [Steroidobacteraceae bacterium]